jgi:hypothetical protein
MKSSIAKIMLIMKENIFGIVGNPRPNKTTNCTPFWRKSIDLLPSIISLILKAVNL